MSGFAYVDIQKNWRGIGPAFHSIEFQRQTVAEIVIAGKADRFGEKPPEEWRWSSLERFFESTRRGRRPAFLEFYASGLCHWQARCNLVAARIWKPDRRWQIVRADLHSTVADIGHGLFFDPQYFGIGVPADETFEKTLGTSHEAYSPNFVPIWNGEIPADLSIDDTAESVRLSKVFKSKVKWGQRKECVATPNAVSFLGV